LAALCRSAHGFAYPFPMDKRVRQTDVTDDLPRSPTGRVPKWVINEAAGHRVDPEPWRAPGSAQPDLRRPKTRRRSFWWWVALCAVLAMGAGILAAYL